MRRVACILSSNYSGSHYLSLLLGSHSRAIHLGEVKNIIKNRPGACYACGDVDSCELLSGIDQTPKSQIYDLLFQRAGDGITCLVDNSKKAYWFEQMVGLPDIELKVIHLIRDPRALMRRWLMNYDSINLQWQQRWRQFRYWNGDPRILLSPILNTYIHKWIWQNKNIRQFIAKHHLDHRTIVYRALAVEPAKTIEPLMDWLGLQFEPGQIEYWNFRHHGTQKQEYDWIKEQAKTGYIDLRWREFLNEEDEALITEHHLLDEFMRSLNIEFGPDGLYYLPKADRQVNFRDP